MRVVNQTEPQKKNHTPNPESAHLRLDIVEERMLDHVIGRRTLHWIRFAAEFGEANEHLRNKHRAPKKKQQNKTRFSKQEENNESQSQTGDEVPPSNATTAPSTCRRDCSQVRTTPVQIIIIILKIFLESREKSKNYKKFDLHWIEVSKRWPAVSHFEANDAKRPNVNLLHFIYLFILLKIIISC